MGILIPWNTYKAFFTESNYGYYLELTDSHKYFLWMEVGGQRLECEISTIDSDESVDKTDFKNNYMDYMNIQKTVVAQTYGYVPNNITSKGRKHIATAGIVSFFDVEIVNEIRIADGSFKISNYSDVHPDDFIEFSLIDKNDTLGLFVYYGLTVGEDILELHKMVRTDYPDEYFRFGHFIGAVPVKAGLFMRFAYSSFGSVDINLKTRIFYFE